MPDSLHGPSVSLSILRDEGPMDLRDLTRATARKMGWTRLYADVDAVMGRHLEEGLVRCEKADDYRENVWTAL